MSDILNEKLVYLNIENSVVFALIPKRFVPMPENYAKLKYPLSNRPAVIMTNEDMKVDFKFELLSALASKDMLEPLTTMVKNNLSKMNSGYQFFEQNIEQTEAGNMVAWFDFSNPAIDGVIYNMMFFYIVDGKVLQGSINCPMVEKEYWKPYMIQCMKSLKEEVSL